MSSRQQGLRERFFFSVKWQVVLGWMLAIGFFVQVSGKVWIVSGSARNTQVYLWLLLPALVFLIYKLIVRSDCRADFQYVPWLLFLGWVALSTLWASSAESDALSLAKRGFFIFLYLVAIYLLMSRNETMFRRALLASVFMVALGALVSLIYQYGFLGKPMGYRAFRIDRMGIGDIANYGWPVAAGIFNGAVAIWAMGIALDRKTDNKQALIWLMAFSVLVVYVLMTGSRGAWFAILAGCVASVIMHKSKRGMWGMGLCVLGALGVSVVLWDQIIVEIETRQLSGRGPIWAYYFDIMSGHWLFGYGLGTPFEYLWPDGKMISPHAHSLFLQQIYDSGLISLGLMLSGLLALCYKSWCLRESQWVRLAFPALIFALVSMLTDVERVFTRPGDYWTVFWLPVAVLLAVPNKKTSS
ncbi:O-antigen ligase family protein [Pseudomonas sp. HLMP]|uniref:O-antigen ligase family protein n=1 Tax=Pseudomonas sp. HLMP TaxID=3153767 RepID=UPI003966B4CC